MVLDILRYIEERQPKITSSGIHHVGNLVLFVPDRWKLFCWQGSMQEEKNGPQKACFAQDELVLDTIRNVDLSIWFSSWKRPPDTWCWEFQLAVFSSSREKSIFWLARYIWDVKNDPQKICFVPDQMMLDIIRNIDSIYGSAAKSTPDTKSCCLHQTGVNYLVGKRKTAPRGIVIHQMK